MQPIAIRNPRKEVRRLRQTKPALIAILVEKASYLDLILDVSAASREVAARCNEPVALDDIANDILRAGIGAGVAMCFGKRGARLPARPMSDSTTPAGGKNRKQRIADALRANLRRRKAKQAADASQDSKAPGEQSANANSRSESGR